MSEKVTFGELIESIAEETDNSKQFTHDFLKDFVDVINGGLEEDGKVNIAGFGKFKLQRVDEREGYNPQTQEKITIPAHNKVIFKPYKDLRELVNAPYAHMEPQLIEDEETESSIKETSSPDQQPVESKTEESGTERDNKTDPEVEQSEQKSEPDTTEISEEQELNEDDFIPTAPPTSHKKEREDIFGNENKPEKEQESPFDFGGIQDSDEDTIPTSTTGPSDEVKDDVNDDGDVVEFNATQSDEEDDLLADFIRSEEQEQQEEPSKYLAEEEEPEPEKNKPAESEEEADEFVLSNEEDDKEEERTKSEEEVLAEEVEKLEEIAKDLKKYQPDKSDTTDEKDPLPTAATSRRSERSSSFAYVAAAVIILLLITGGAWYYSTLPTNDTLISSSEETATSADATNQQDDSNQQQLAEQQETQDAQQTAQNQSQSTQTPASTQSTKSTTPDNQAVEIEEGQTLWSLAEDRYGNPRLWPWIYGNNGSLDDPDLIYAGSSLSVPLPSGPQNTLTNTDSVGVAKGYIATYKWYKSNEKSKAKDHLWAAKLYHNDLQQLADVPIDKADLSYANRAR
ncbi:hypothetical protein CK503_15100 [Aliifodinibius salipaludis]|uniref:LysM domain-containing protein n=1 Tax=Fodinibius salipaludis TaxID=2032627 RepID=A0A2A2G7J0_9BACT|nr:HU family DNA-binding protein [Aliifodinibius salipaludis]PAU92815.1 hypothetical protein CK503_15100 [Aliifodinibius salipaludis]